MKYNEIFDLAFLDYLSTGYWFPREGDANNSLSKLSKDDMGRALFDIEESILDIGNTQ